jgi:hypothetical protein
MKSLLDEGIKQLIKLRAYQKTSEAYAYDPIAWCLDAFGDEYVPRVEKIKDAAKTVLDNQKNIVYGINGTGKTFFFSGMFSLWWIFGRNAKNSSVVIAGPHSSHTKKGFAYIAEMIEVNHARHEAGLTTIWLDGRVSQQANLRINGVDVILARSPRQGESNATALLGGHTTGGTCIIVDEADGLNETLIKSALRNVTGKRDIGIFLTNPNNPDSQIGKYAKWYEDMLAGREYEQSSWAITQIGWKDMPTNPESDKFNSDIPKIQKDNLIQENTILGFTEDYGVGTPGYNTTVLGRYDYFNLSTFITTHDINKGIITQADSKADYIGRPTIGVDLALFGEDDTVAYGAWQIPTLVEEHDDTINDKDEHKCTENCRETTKIITKLKFIDALTDNKANQHDQAKWLADICRGLGAIKVHFDAAGLGAPFAKTFQDELARQGLDTVAIGLIGSTRNLAGEVYNNDRSYWWGNMKERLRHGEIDLDEEDERLIKELKMLSYSRDTAGRIALQSKRDLKKSPDYADSAVLAVIPDEQIQMMLAPKKTEVVPMEEVYENLYSDDDFYDEFDEGDPCDEFFPKWEV